MSTCRKLHVGAKAGFSCASSAVHLICLAMTKERQLVRERKCGRTCRSVLKAEPAAQVPNILSSVDVPGIYGTKCAP